MDVRKQLFLLIIIARAPDHPRWLVSRLVLALETKSAFRISDIHLLNYHHFKLALEILQEWRIDQHFASKTKLFDASRQLAQTPQMAPKQKKTSARSSK